MISLILFSLISNASVFASVFASENFVATFQCLSESLGGTVKIHVFESDDGKATDLVEFYSPSGLGVGYLGESFLDSSYVVSGAKKSSSANGFTYHAKLSTDGAISLSINSDLNVGTGSVRLSAHREAEHDLTDCKKK